MFIEFSHGSMYWCEVNTKVFICFILVKNMYGLVPEGNVLISKEYSKDGRIAFCVVWVTGEGTFIGAKSHTGP